MAVMLLHGVHSNKNNLLFGKYTVMELVKKE
jgi:hypothetical protein